MRRHITLYYASISLSNSLLALFLAVAFWFRKPERLRSRLVERVQRTFLEGAWFCFGSARGALAACLQAAGVGEGDEVIVTSYTCLAVPTAVVAAGARPVYVDVDPATLNSTCRQVLDAVTVHTRAVVVQHTIGNPADVDEILRAVKPMGITVIEDCALSLGAYRSGKPVGSWADAAVFSMELSKTLSCGWGGLLRINAPELRSSVERLYGSIPEQSRLQSLRDLLQTVISTWCSHPAFVDFPGKYVMWLAWKLRFFRPSTPPDEFEGKTASDFVRKMGIFQALLARLQWKDWQLILDRCRTNVELLRSDLVKLEYRVPALPSGVDLPLSNRVSFFVRDRESIVRFFRQHRIELGTWFDGPLSPVPSAPVFNYHPGRYPLAELAAAHVVNLPAHNRLKMRDVQNIRHLLSQYRTAHPDSGAAF